ncbi:hypothetical protein [Paenibacillus polymyxa]|uniref:hypothetical protein n=1 Tax=Paenibacillus polymyxa TaxID=1406 RepID=UPI002AB4AC8A|nr:hypothetical protein [Paenibacillus polymyxa]MDY8021126.1 hypothetical protein [Paenibacillus polymyxa]
MNNEMSMTIESISVIDKQMKKIDKKIKEASKGSVEYVCLLKEQLRLAQMEINMLRHNMKNG